HRRSDGAGWLCALWRYGNERANPRHAPLLWPIWPSIACRKRRQAVAWQRCDGRIYRGGRRAPRLADGRGDLGLEGYLLPGQRCGPNTRMGRLADTGPYGCAEGAVPRGSRESHFCCGWLGLADDAVLERFG